MIMKNKHKGFTLIEIIIYCSIFIIFAVVAIQSIIWVNSQLVTFSRLSENINTDIYKMNFSNIYNRYRLNSPRIESDFYYLIASSSKTQPIIIEDSKMNIILNKNSARFFNHKKEEKIDILFFNSIDNGV